MIQLESQDYKYTKKLWCPFSSTVIPSLYERREAYMSNTKGTQYVNLSQQLWQEMCLFPRVVRLSHRLSCVLCINASNKKVKIENSA